MTTQRVDVAVAGGGPAGLSLAMCLARRNYSVVVIERSGYDAPRVGETFPPILNRLLDDLGIGDGFEEQGHLPCHGTRSAWGQATLQAYESMFNPYGAGWHVDRAAFDGWLSRIAEQAGVRVIRKARAESITESGEERWLVDTGGEPALRLSARIAVDATGRVGWLAKRMGARRMCVDRLVGVVAFLNRVRGVTDNDDTVVEAVEHGWWYSAPLPDGRLVLDYMTDSDLCRTASQHRVMWWNRALQRTVHTACRVDGCAPVVRVQVAAASTSRLDSTVGDRWLAVGDAAMTLDPLSSLGVFKAIESGLRAAEAIHRHLMGRPGAFGAYDAWSRRSFLDSLRARRTYYSREQRWPQSWFWRRRQREPDREPSERRYPSAAPSPRRCH